MGFSSGLSGLSSSARNLDVIGNNVANASVVGFKGSVAQFADVFAAATSGGGTQAGIGSRVKSVAQMFDQGNITPTRNPLDIAISGRGFFRLSDQGTIVYSRNGQFRLDNAGFIVNPSGLNVTGYGVDANGNILNAAPEPLQFDTSDIAPRSTTRFEASVNLDSRTNTTQSANEPPLSGAIAFSPTNTRSFNYTTSGSIYDSLGNQHVMTMYFVRQPDPLVPANPGSTYQLYVTNDGGPVSEVDLGLGAGAPALVTFDAQGNLTATTPPTLTVSATLANGAITPLLFDFSLAGSTHYGSVDGVTALSQDGYASGRLSGFDVSTTGIITGKYTNGQSSNLGQLVLADFVNPQGLTPLGDNLWTDTIASGLPLVAAPGSGTIGNLQSGAVEDSNVELTSELVGMITAQRVYQANAQTIKTQDAILQTIVNLR
jgi:flagellar hook protein FlgE